MERLLKIISILFMGVFLTTSITLAEDSRILELGNNLDFGSVTIGESVTKELTLYNRGNSDLTIEKLRFHNRIVDAFSGNYEGVIPAGKEQNVTITFTPKAGVDYQGLVYIESDRTNTNDRSLLLSGVGIDENDSVETRILDFYPRVIEFIGVNTQELTIYNLGNSALTIHELRFHERLKGAFSIDFLGESVIPSGDSIKVEITFTPLVETEYYDGLLYIESDKTDREDNGCLLTNHRAEDNNLTLILPTEVETCDLSTAISREELRLMIANGEDVTHVNTCNITDMSHLFEGEYSFNQDISSWDTTNVTDMSYMFFRAYSFNQSLNDWNVSNIINMNAMFYGAKEFNQPLNEWNVSSVTNMSWIFYGAKAFNQPLNSWEVSNVLNMNSMFYNAISFNQPLKNWNVTNVTNMRFMFYLAENFNQDIKDWNVVNVSSYINFALNSLLEELYNPFMD